MSNHHRITFRSGDVDLVGSICVPSTIPSNNKAPAFIVMHGFGSTMGAGNVLRPCAILEQLGYITFRYDQRGCGKSGGQRGNLIPLEQVEDVRSAISVLEKHPQVDSSRIAMLGSSFGAAISIYAAATDSRISAVISASGFGNGKRKFRGQHKTEESWQRFHSMMEAGKKHRQEKGEPLMVPRYEIVPMPEELRTHVLEGSIQSFTSETAQSTYEFNPEDQIALVAPRPVLLLHSASDSVTPVSESVHLFERAGQPAELHAFAETDHFLFAEQNKRVHAVLIDWLNAYFPARQATLAIS